MAYRNLVAKVLSLIDAFLNFILCSATSSMMLLTASVARLLSPKKMQFAPQKYSSWVIREL